MADDNKPLKYARYAIGEILLVVIGILIALQINSWNQKNIDARKEREILHQLKQEYLENLNELDGKISMRNDILRSTRKLLNNTKNTQVSIPTDTLALHLGTVSFFPTFNPTMGVTQELINSGNLYILRSEQLKKELTNISGTYEKLKEIEQVIVNFVTEQYAPYCVEHFKMNEIIIQKLSQGLFKKSLIGELALVGTEPNSNRDEINRMLSDDVVISYIKYISDYNYVANAQSMGVKKSIDLMLELINHEIE